MRDSSSLVIGEVAYYHFRIIIRQYHFNTIGIAQLQHDSVQYLCHGHPCNNSNNIALHSTLITSDQLTHQLFHCKPLLSSPRLQAVNLCSHAFQNNIPRLPGPTVPILPWNIFSSVPCLWIALVAREPESLPKVHKIKMLSIVFRAISSFFWLRI